MRLACVAGASGLRGHGLGRGLRAAAAAGPTDDPFARDPCAAARVAVDDLHDMWAVLAVGDDLGLSRRYSGVADDQHEITNRVAVQLAVRAAHRAHATVLQRLAKCTGKV